MNRKVRSQKSEVRGQPFLAGFSLLAICCSLLTNNGWACAVCFGAGSGNLQRGFYWGILMLLLLPIVLILAISAKIFLAVRKKNLSAYPPHPAFSLDGRGSGSSIQ